MIQIIPWTTAQTLNGTSANTYWWDLLAGCSQSASATEVARQSPVAADGTFRNLCVDIATAPGTGKSWTFMFRVNGADTGLTFTISGTATSGRIENVDVAVSAGDIITFQQTSTNNPTSTAHSGTIEFASQTDYISIYGGGGMFGVGGGGTTVYDGALRASANLQLATTAEAAQPVAAAGDFTALYSYVSGSTGATNGVTFYLNLNGVRQDGAGATVDTSLSMIAAPGAGTLSSTFTLPVLAGDVVYVEVVAAATDRGGRWLSLGVQFTATTADEYMVAGYRGTRVALDAETFFGVPQVGTASFASDTTFGAGFYVGPSGIILSNPRLLLTAAPGVGKSRNVVLRRNSTDTAVVMTAVDLAVDATVALSEAYVDNELVSLRQYGTGTPAATGFAWTYRTGPAPPVDPIPGGGVVVGVEPTPADIPVGIVRTFVRFTLEDGSPPTEMSFSTTTLSDPPSWFGGLKKPLLTGISPITRQLSTSVQGITVRLVFVDDTSRTFRNLAATGTIGGALAEVFVVSDTTRYALEEPYRLFAGRVRGVRFPSGFGVEIEAVDLLSEALEIYGDSALVPPSKLSVAEFPAMDAQFEGKAIPIVFGLCSDTHEPGNIAIGPQGVIPPVIVASYLPGTNTPVVNLSDFGGINMDVVCSIISHGPFAINGMIEVYYNTPSNPYVRIPVPSSQWGVNMFSPGMPGWASTGITTPMYIDYPLPAGPTTRRYTPFVINAAHPNARLWVDGKILVGINCAGISETETGADPYIDDAPRIYQWLVNNYLFTQWLSGPYNQIPTLAPGYSIIATLTVQATTDRLNTFLGVSPGSYPVGFMLGRDGQQQTLRHVLEEICAGVAMEQGTDRHGRLMLDVEDPTSVATVSLTDLLDIEEGQFDVWVERNEYLNKIEYVHGYRYLPPVAPIPAPADGEPLPESPIPPYAAWTSGLQSVSDTAAITANGGRERTKFFENYVVRSATVAANVYDRLLAQAVGPDPSLDGPRKFRLTTTYPQGLGIPGSPQVEVELGTVIEMDHIEGLGTSGWVGRRGRVLSITDDPLNARRTLEGRVLYTPGGGEADP